jgi:hypothetical protein
MESIIRARISVLKQGPAPRRLVPVSDTMKSESEIAMWSTNYGAYQQARIVPLRDAKISVFIADEIALEGKIVSTYWGQNGKNLLNLITPAPHVYAS